MGAARIVDATPEDAPALLRLVAELAAFEGLAATVTIDEERLARDLAGPAPRCRAKLAFEGDDAVGYATFGEVYFSFTGPWVYLDDLYVREDRRSRGLGRALLAAVSRAALDAGCHGMAWTVLHDNTPAQRFYEGLGARLAREWWPVRVEGPAALRAFAARLEGA